MRYRLLKFLTTSVNILFLWVLYRLFTGALDMRFTTGCLVISGFWLGFTYFRLNRLFQTYVSVLARLQILVPLTFGIIMDGLALFSLGWSPWAVPGLVELAGWLGIYLLFQRNKERFVREGHGPLPKGVWVDPPACALRPGDLILTNGRMANLAHDAVGHGELVLVDPDGNIICFSAYMGEGTVINPILRTTRGNSKDGGFYIAMRLKEPLTADELKRAYVIAQEMYVENRLWTARTNIKRTRIITALPLPRKAKFWLLKHCLADGYDWQGLITGIRRKHAWICIGADLELFRRLLGKDGMKKRGMFRYYGSGLFGLGTGFLDPIAPVRFVYDPAFRLLTEEDKKACNCSDPPRGVR